MQRELEFHSPCIYTQHDSSSMWRVFFWLREPLRLRLLLWLSNSRSNSAFTIRPRVSGKLSLTRCWVAVRSMWLALSFDLRSLAFQHELSLHHLGPVERQTSVCRHPPSRLQTSLAHSRWVRCFL